MPSLTVTIMTETDMTQSKNVSSVRYSSVFTKTPDILFQTTFLVFYRCYKSNILIMSVQEATDAVKSGVNYARETVESVTGTAPTKLTANSGRTDAATNTNPQGHNKPGASTDLPEGDRSQLADLKQGTSDAYNNGGSQASKEHTAG
jgi:hypothetical protein